MNDEREFLGLYSRDYGLAQLERALAGAKQQGTTAAILLADIDRFAALNCSFGHHYGDDVLRQLGRLAEGFIGAKGTISRYGATDYFGDEFLIVLPSASLVEAENLAAQMNERVSQHKFYYNESDRFHLVTLTIGIALYPADGENAEFLLRAVEGAVSHGKQIGRGAIYLAQKLSATS